MSIILKKKKNEVIQKVNVKMACVCSPSQYSCRCTCIGNEVFSHKHGAPEAETCGEVYAENYVKFPIS